MLRTRCVSPEALVLVIVARLRMASCSSLPSVSQAGRRA